MSSNPSTPDESLIHDESRPKTGAKGASGPSGEPSGEPSGGQIPKPKRIACVICRKRKLKCDGTKPSCSNCTRLNHDCSYNEVRRKSGPKRGYVKALEQRLKQVETLLNSKEASAQVAVPISSRPGVDFDEPNADRLLATDRHSNRWRYSPQPALDDAGFDRNMVGMEDTTFSWEMIGLGLEEPLPKQEIIDDLHHIYFEKIHPSIPMIQKYRYLAAMNFAPTLRPPVALRYAMWTLAASITEKYMDLKDQFYQRARKYVEMDEMKGFGEHMITVPHSQIHTLLASYEFKMMYFPRAWTSTGKAIRLAQMMGLHRLDGVGLEVKQCLPAPRDWTEQEERRRTFWMAFCEDRYASIGTGWPMTVDEKDITTDLPSSEKAFEMSTREKTPSLPDALYPSGAGKLSSFAGVILMACLFGRNLIHLHRPDADDRDDDLNGEFWKRHRHMDHILLNTSLSLPSHLKLPNGLSNPNIVFTNMNIHTSTICLHQAAIFKAEKNGLPATVSAESKVRCLTAAGEIASIMRMISHLDLSAMNPFIAFCLYVAARVFVQSLKTHPENGPADDSLSFLLSAMNALKKKNPLTESFLVQLDVDLEGLRLLHPQYKKPSIDDAFVANPCTPSPAKFDSWLHTDQFPGAPNLPSNNNNNNNTPFPLYDHNLDMGTRPPTTISSHGGSSRRGHDTSDSGGEMDSSPVSASHRPPSHFAGPADARPAPEASGARPSRSGGRARSYETSPAMRIAPAHGATTAFSFEGAGAYGGGAYEEKRAFGGWGEGGHGPMLGPSLGMGPMEMGWDHGEGGARNR